jgi:hypothetical protein
MRAVVGASGALGVGEGHARAAVDEHGHARAGRAHGLEAEGELEADDEQGEDAEGAQAEQAEAGGAGQASAAAKGEAGLDEGERRAGEQQRGPQRARGVAGDQAPALHVRERGVLRDR